MNRREKMFASKKNLLFSGLFFLFWLFSQPLFAQKPAHCDLPNLLLVIDTSGSMAQSHKLLAAQKAIINTVSQFKDKIRFGLIHFSKGKATLDLQIGPNDPKQRSKHIQKLIAITKRLKAIGNTPMTAALRLARKNYTSQVIPNDPYHRQKKQNDSRSHFILVLTDGVPTDGDPSTELLALRKLNVEGKHYDVKTYFIGLGPDKEIQPFLLNQWAKLGGTENFYHARKNDDLAKLFLIISTDALTKKEICNGVDDDCDGLIDENVRRECHSRCSVGLMICKNGHWSACNAPKPQKEVCDGHDNDCDGQVDEDLVRPCQTSCGKGKQLCINGDWSRCDAPEPQLEICNGKDDDCDGTIDNQAVACPNGKCVHDSQKGFYCSIPCRHGECPAGFSCNSQTQLCEELPCRHTQCQPGEICINKRGHAICKNICQGVHCPAGLTCGRNGTCINCYEKPCPPQMVCKEGKCVLDKCALVHCAPHQGCSDGVCFDTCLSKKCPKGQRCQTTDPNYPKSICFVDACAGVRCPPFHVCFKGSCIRNKCLNNHCPSHLLCDPKTGLCSDNPCQWTHCPKGSVCVLGECKKGPPQKIESCPQMQKGRCCKDENCGPNLICEHGFCIEPLQQKADAPSPQGCSCQQTSSASSSSLTFLLFLLFLFKFAFKRRRKKNSHLSA